MKNKSSLLTTSYILSLIMFISSLVVFIADFGFADAWKGFMSMMLGLPLLGMSVFIFIITKVAKYIKNKDKITLGNTLFGILTVASIISLIILLTQSYMSWQAMLIFGLSILFILISNILILVFLNQKN